MPIWTYKCPNPACGLQREMLFHTVQQRDHTAVICRVCCNPMDRVLDAPAFKVNGYNAGNGYSVEGSK